MSVRINSTYSKGRKICGGSPQGSLLGNFLFCLTTDCFARLGEEVEDTTTPPVEAWGPPDGGGQLVEAGDTDPDTLSTDEDKVCPRRPRLRRDWDSSEDEEECAASSQYQLNSFFSIPAGWAEKDLFDCVYIDDYNTVEKILVKNSPLHITQAKQKILVHAPKTEKRFVRLCSKADEIGMRINKKKTQLL